MRKGEFSKYEIEHIGKKLTISLFLNYLIFEFENN